MIYRMVKCIKVPPNGGFTRGVEYAATVYNLSHGRWVVENDLLDTVTIWHPNKTDNWFHTHFEVLEKEVPVAEDLFAAYDRAMSIL